MQYFKKLNGIYVKDAEAHERIDNEQIAREHAIQSEASERQQAIQSEASERQQAIQNEQIAREQAIQSEASERQQAIQEEALQREIIHSLTTPDEDERAEYKNEVRKNLVSYLVRNNFSSCMTGDAINTGCRTVFKYGIGKTYLGVLGGSDFIYNETEVINGATYKVAYMDCSTFISLVTRGKDFENSPYYYVFTKSTIDKNELFMTAIEDLDPEKNYLYDCLNNVKTDNMARIIDNSGCTLRTLSTNTITDGVTVDENVKSTLETGDLLFIGNSRNAEIDGDFNGIYHVGMYVETLEELNAIAPNSNITFNTITGETSEIGYIVEVWNDNTVAYQDTLVINTVEAWINKLENNNWSKVFVTKVYANALNSNKQYALATGMYRTYDGIRFVHSTQYSTPDFAGQPILDLKGTGSFMGCQANVLANRNIDNMKYDEDTGVWKVYSGSDLETITGDIPLNALFTLYVNGTDSGKAASQILTLQTTGNTRTYAFYRCSGSNSADFTPWKRLDTAIQRGSESFGVINAGSYQTFHVTFPEAFLIEPYVQLTLNTNTEHAGLGSLNMVVKNITKTGFDVVCANNGTVNITMGCTWQAC